MKRFLLPLLPLAVLALAGCVDTIAPVSLSLSFQSAYTRNDDGTCDAKLTVLVAGAGTATWQEVTVERGSLPVLTYSGSDVAKFWGSTQISAGQIQESTPFAIPGGSTGANVTLRYSVGAKTQDVSLRMECATPV